MESLSVPPKQEEFPPFMSVRQVARYLQLNEKKIYSLLKDGEIPGTKVTGKWLFPRELIDRWLLDSSHGGILHDRLIITGGEDLLLQRVAQGFAQQNRSHALIAYSPTGTRLGLDLLQAGRADVCALHWGPDSESSKRHPALLRRYSQHRQWVLARLYRRRVGVLLDPRLNLEHNVLDELLDISQQRGLRWSLRPSGSGIQRYFIEAINGQPRAQSLLEEAVEFASEREAAASIAMRTTDCAPGTEATAVEFGLGFLPLGWEAFELVLPRQIYFRHLFQQLLGHLKSESSLSESLLLKGYDLSQSGQIVWSEG